MVLSSVATILASNIAAVEGPPPRATALLPLAAINQKCVPVPFAADVNSAEKGIHSPAIDTSDMQRSSTTAHDATSSPAGGNLRSSIEEEQASSSGASRYAELVIPIKGSLKQRGDEGLKDSQALGGLTTSSYTSLDYETTTHAESSTRNKGDTNPKVVDTGYERFIDKSYESYPPGFPQLAAFLNSADNFAIARRFGTAHSRVLLHLSCEITALEKRLVELDEADSAAITKYRLRRIEHHEKLDPAQKILIDSLKLKLAEYDDFLFKDCALRALPPAPARDHLNVYHWIYSRKPLDVGQYDFIYHCDDFVSLASPSRSGFDNFIKSCLNRWPTSHAQRFLKDGNETHGVRDRNVHFFSSEKISLAARIMAICVAVTILLIPVFLLFLTQVDRSVTAAMILLFVLAFATLMCLFTGARAETVFIGTCTYCAVLVTFLGNVQGTAATHGPS